MPLLFAGYVIAYLDRANIAFANVAISTDLGFSRAVFGFGAGIFFLGYFLFQVPVTLLIERHSPRLWIGGMLICWGLCTVATALVRTGPQFYGARFLLGCAEAGFYPGVVVYLSHWFPERDRARALATFVMAAPLALALGAPVSAVILHADWPVGASWQWLFILQGAPGVALGCVILKYLADRPATAVWLLPEHREWLTTTLESESRAKPDGNRRHWWSVLSNANVALVAGANLLANIAGYAFLFWLPANLRSLGSLSSLAGDAAGFLPFAAAMPALWLVARSSDRTGERKLHACVPMLIAAASMTAVAVLTDSVLARFLLLIVTGASMFAWVPGFWQLPAASFSREAAAAAVGIVNAAGSLGGFLGPWLTGVLGSTTEPITATAAVMATSYVAAALLVSFVSTTAGGRAAALATASTSSEVT